MNSNDRQPKLILFPGLGADERMFMQQLAAFPHAMVPRWIPPKKREGLAEYAVRLVKTLPQEESMVFAGVSLGGMIACEAARFIRPKAVILIAGCRQRNGLRWIYRVGAKLWPIIPQSVFRIAQGLATPTLRLLSKLSREQQTLLVEMFREMDPAFMHWAVSAILSWNPEPLEGIPVYHIHGRRDGMIPARRVTPDVWIKDGGHLINLTHADEVNKFISDSMHGKLAHQT